MSKLLFSSLIASTALIAACGGSSAPNQNAGQRANTPATPAPATNAPVSTPAVSQSPSLAPSNTATPRTNANSSANAERPRVVEPKKSSGTSGPSGEIPSADEMRKAFSKPVTQDDVNDPGMRRSEPMMRSKSSNSTMMRSKPDEVPMRRSNRKPANNQ
jgi:hypothetical protein